MFSRFDTIPACDGQTDGRTDVKAIAITCFSIADARKNRLQTTGCDNANEATFQNILENVVTFALKFTRHQRILHDIVALEIGRKRHCCLIWFN